MATVTKTFSGFSTHYLQLDVNETGVYSIEDNTSEISYRLSLNKVSSSSGAFTDTPYPAEFYIDGQKKDSANVVYDVRNTLSQTLLEGTLNIAHGPDGKKTISCYGKYTTSGALGSATTPNLSLKLVDIPLYQKLFIKLNGQYKSGFAWIKQNGSFKKGSKIFVKVNGVWKESKVYV